MHVRETDGSLARDVGANPLDPAAPRDTTNKNTFSYSYYEILFINTKVIILIILYKSRSRDMNL